MFHATGTDMAQGMHILNPAEGQQSPSTTLIQNGAETGERIVGPARGRGNSILHWRNNGLLDHGMWDSLSIYRMVEWSE